MKSAILSERLQRQCFADPVNNPEDYKRLFMILQPVSPVFFGMPGDPPRLLHRAVFDDSLIADQMREDRTIIKGRFLGGTIGYVFASDLELYSNAFCRPLPWFSDIQQKVFNAIKYAGPLTPRQIKEETGLLNKQISPVLNRLQEAFLVYEDQADSSWERGWYEFAAEWHDVNIDERKREASIRQVLLRFIQGHVFATMEQIKDWSQLPSKLLTTVVHEMEKSSVIITKTVDGLGEGWLCAQDISLERREIPPSVFMIHRADFLARSHVSELKQRFGRHKVLQYLLIDGEFKGAVIGHWRIGPHDVDDIIVELSETEKTRRRKEIFNAVAWHYKPPYSHILKYAGKEV